MFVKVRELDTPRVRRVPLLLFWRSLFIVFPATSISLGPTTRPVEASAPTEKMKKQAKLHIVLKRAPTQKMKKRAKLNVVLKICHTSVPPLCLSWAYLFLSFYLCDNDRFTFI